jgi:hypothetical protein
MQVDLAVQVIRVVLVVLAELHQLMPILTM